MNEPRQGAFTSKSPLDRLLRRQDNDQLEEDQVEVGDALKNLIVRPGLFRVYGGDLYGTRGCNADGILYMSRLENRKSSKFNKSMAETKKRSEERLKAANSKQVSQVSPLVIETKFKDQKRKCAEALEKMVRSRLHVGEEDNSAGIMRLIDDGLLQSIGSLVAISDPTTQEHCARAVYFLCECEPAKKAIIQSGILSAFSSFLGSASQFLKYGIACILCRLSEDPGLEQLMLSEGVDKIITRLCRSSKFDVRNVCCWTLFNITCNEQGLTRGADMFILCLSNILKISSHPAITVLLVKSVFNISLDVANHVKLVSEGVVRLLCNPIQKEGVVDDELLQYSFLSLINLCTTKTTRKQLMQDSAAVGSFIQLMTYDNPKIKHLVAILMLRLASDGESQAQLVKRGVVEAIVSSASEYSSDIALTYSWLLRYLCSCNSVKERSVEEGVGGVLLGMCYSDSKQIKINGLWAMCSLMDGTSDHDSFSMEDTIRDLLSFLQTDDEAVKTMCISAMYNISCTSTGRSKLSQQGGIFEALVKTTRGSLERPRKFSMMAIFNLSTVDVFRDRLLKDGGLECIQDFIKNPNLDIYAIGTIGHMTAHTDFPTGEALSRTLQNLLGLATKDTSVEALRAGAWLLSILARNSANRGFMIRKSVMKFIRYICSTDDDVLSRFSVHMLADFALEQGETRTLFHEGIVPILINLSRSSNDMIKELGVISVCRLSYNKGFEYEIVSQGAIAAVMIMALVSTDSESIKVECAKTICNCLSEPRCIRRMVADGVLWGLTTLCELPNHQVQASCAVAFCNLSLVRESREKMLEAGVPRALIKLSKTSWAETTVACMKAISNFLSDEAFCVMLVHEGVVALLRQLFASDQAAIVYSAANVLLKITCVDDRCRVSNLNNGLLGWISNISKIENDTLSRNCVITLHDLSQHPLTSHQVDAAQVLDILNRVADKSSSIDEQLLCSRVIYNMSCQSPQVNQLIRLDAMESMTRFLQRVESEKNSGLIDKLIELYVWTLHNLSCTEGLQADLVMDGYIPVIQSLYFQQRQHRPVLATTLSNIVLGQVNTSRIVHDGGNTILGKYIQTEENISTDQYLLLSAALRKLVCPPGNHTAAIKGGALGAFISILSSPNSSVDAKLNCLEAFGIFAAVQGNRGRMVEEGVIATVIKVANSDYGIKVKSSCFNILTNLAAIDTDDYEVDLDDHFISTLMSLSELQAGAKSADPRLYCERGVDGGLPPAVLNSSLMVGTKELSSVLVQTHEIPWAKLQASDDVEYYTYEIFIEDRVDLPQNIDDTDNSEILGQYLPKSKLPQDAWDVEVRDARDVITLRTAATLLAEPRKSHDMVSLDRWSGRVSPNIRASTAPPGSTSRVKLQPLAHSPDGFNIPRE